MSSYLVLWDVDYTLVNAYGVGRHLYQLAFAELYGRELPKAASEAGMAGRTDRAIALDVLTLAGLPDPASEVAVFEATLTRLAPSVADMVAASGKILPGAADAVTALAGIPGVRQSLLTGNIRALAVAKLEPLGMTAHLDLGIGAYGNEHQVRSELVPLARRRASAACGEDFSGRATVLVGDTPLDVEAALAAGARAVGVATGQFSERDLKDAGADAVLPDLTETAEVIGAVLGG